MREGRGRRRRTYADVSDVKEEVVSVLESEHRLNRVGLVHFENCVLRSAKRTVLCRKPVLTHQTEVGRDGDSVGRGVTGGASGSKLEGGEVGGAADVCVGNLRGRVEDGGEDEIEESEEWKEEWKGGWLEGR